MNNSFVTVLWNLIVAFFQAVPWLIIAAVAFLAYRRNKTRGMALLIQTGAAALLFILPLFDWLIMLILRWLNATYDVVHAVGIIFSFLFWASLCLFAAGYCLEKFKKPVAGFPVQP